MCVHVCVLIWSCTCKYMSVCLHVCVCHSQVPQAALWCLTLSVSIFIFWDRVSFWTQSSPITLGWLISEWALEICQSLYPKDWDYTHDHCNWLLHRSRGSNSPAQQKGALKRGTCDQTIETMAPPKLEFLQESLAGARQGNWSLAPARGRPCFPQEMTVPTVGQITLKERAGNGRKQDRTLAGPAGSHMPLALCLSIHLCQDHESKTWGC